MANMVAENQDGIVGNEHRFFGNIGRGPTQMGSRTLRMVLKEHSLMYTNKGTFFKASADLYSAATRYTSVEASTIVKSVTGLAEVEAWSKFHQNCSRRT